MSTHLHLDLVGGIAGDMTVAALIDAGVEPDRLRAGLEATGLPFTDLHVERTWRGGLAGTTVRVADEVDPPSRTWAVIRTLLAEARLSDGARERALDIFERLARAEARVHGCDVDEVHFHEVGAMDSIVDVVATALGLEHLGVTSASCGAVPLCQGSVSSSHGTLPLPAPATGVLLEGFRVTSVPGDLETVTPTGAAILASLCPHGGGVLPPMTLGRQGLGLGTAETEGRPNVLRVLLGQRQPAEPRAPRGDAVVLEASIDDMDPRLYGAVAEDLFAAGALDVALLPLQMKKGRPGTQLQVVCRPELEGVLTGLVLRETTTLGVRSHDVRRTELERRFETVETPYGSVSVKRGYLGDACLNVAPEYDDCLARARTAGVPVKDVLAAAVAAALRSESPA